MFGVRSSRELVLFTTSYPYAGTEAFLETEIQYLASRFERVTVVPRIATGRLREVPSNVTVDASIASAPYTLRRRISVLMLAFASSGFHREILRFAIPKRSPVMLWRAAAFIETAVATRRWVRGHLGSVDQLPLFYTYWLGPQTYGVGLEKLFRPEIVLVSRAHRGDLYEDVHSPPYLPYRRQTLAAVDKLFVISEHGRNYLIANHPAFTDRYAISRLGVMDPGTETDRSSDDVFRIVSCSFVVPVKRLELLADGISEFAKVNGDVKVEWTHLGDGPAFKQLERHVSDTMPSNVTARLRGYVDNKQVIEYYHTHPVDVFANVSASEGIPVSIMEAQSFGIPVMATNVGGTSETVSDQNGVLLDSNPSPAEISAALKQLGHQEVNRRKRALSREAFTSRFDANANYAAFADELAAMIGSASHA